jgi:hypothetical protein
MLEVNVYGRCRPVANRGDIVFFKNVTLDHGAACVRVFSAATVLVGNNVPAEHIKALVEQFREAKRRFGPLALDLVSARTPYVPATRPDNRTALRIIAGSSAAQVVVPAQITLISGEATGRDGELGRNKCEVCDSGYCGEKKGVLSLCA